MTYYAWADLGGMGPWLPELGPNKFRERSSGASIMQENLLITAFIEKINIPMSRLS